MKSAFPGSALRYVTDASGQLEFVQIPASLWEHMEPRVRDLLEPPHGDSESPAEPLEAFAEFMRFWDFPYAYSPAVRCPHCGSQSTDWRSGSPRPFRLANANLGGLLVFHCQTCGATIRQKHFRDHVALESTPGVTRNATPGSVH